MKRPIDGADLAGKLRTRKANAVGHPEVMDAYETAMNDAIDAEELSLNELRDEVYEDAVAHGLWESIDYTVKEILDEAEGNGDLFDDPDEIRRGWCMEPIRKEVDELEMASDSYENYIEELADVIIMCLSVAGKLGIDIDAAVKRKMQINKGRPWKHGKE